MEIRGRVARGGDCMIASVARRHGAALLALDADLVRVADVVGITLDDASRLD